MRRKGSSTARASAFDGGSRARALRLRVRSFLPVALFALLLQILAPVGASWIAASTVTDPLRGIEICHSEADTESAPADRNGDRHARIDCLFCCVLHAGGVLDTPGSATFAVPLRLGTGIAWHGADFDLLPARHVSHAQARAPPSPS
jgi:hypothetical protein